MGDKLKKLIPQGMKKENVPTLVYLLGIFCVLPLVLHNGYFDTTATKFVCFTVIAVATVFLCLIFSPKESSVKKEKLLTEIDKVFLFFAGAFVISALLSKNKPEVFFGGGERFQGVVTILVYFMLLYITERRFIFSKVFFYASIAVMGIVCLIACLNDWGVDPLGFYNDLGEENKVKFVSTIGNVNFYSSYLCLFIPMAFAGFVGAKGKGEIAFFAAITAFAGCGAAVTSSESFVFGFLCMLGLLPLFFFNNPKKLVRVFLVFAEILAVMKIYTLLKTADNNIAVSALLKILLSPYVLIVIFVIFSLSVVIALKKPQLLPAVKKIWLAVLIVAVAGLIILMILANTVFVNTDFGKFESFLKITDSWGTNRGRTWKFCISEFKNYSFLQVLFGVGPESLGTVTAKSGFYETKQLDQAHNEFLNYLMTVGVCGLASYLALLFVTAKTVLKELKNDYFAIALFAGVCAYAVQSFFNIAQPFTTPIYFAFLSCLAGLKYKKTNAEVF